MPNVLEESTRGRVTRGTLAVAAIVALSTAAAASPPASVIPRPPGFGNANAGGECVLRTSGKTTTARVSVIQGGISMERQISYERDSQTVTTSITISKGPNLIVKVEASTGKGGASTAAIHYGAEVKGVREVTIRSQDGKSIQGTMDGRAFTAGDARRSIPVGRGQTQGHSQSAAMFSDGRGTPQISADPKLAPLVHDLSVAVNAALASCHAAPPSPFTPGPGPIRLESRETGANGSPGSGWYEPGGTYDSPNCTNCWHNCGDTAERYSGLDSWETYLCAPCVAAAIVAYNAIWLSCWGTCQLPGGGCCPVSCGGAFTCCGRGDSCFRGDLCCPGSMAVCSNVCCGFGVKSCAPDGSCGCQEGQSVCGKDCCAAGNVCCGNQCCAAGENQCCGNQCCPKGAACLSNNTCCATPNYVCGNTCCSPFDTCIQGLCCKNASDVVIQGACCAAENACGNACCQYGQVCKDGSCTALACDRGQDFCTQPNGHALCCNLYQCDNVTNGDVCTPNCCNGACCAPGQVCCTNPSGFGQGCNDPIKCYRVK